MRKLSFTTDFSVIIMFVMILSFAVNIIVQMTKGIISLPTKLWCIIVAFAVDFISIIVLTNLKIIVFNISWLLIAFLGSFIIAYIAMYGFDTFKELWKRFKNGEKI